MAEQQRERGLSFAGYLTAAVAAGLLIVAGLLLWRLSYVLMLAAGAMVIAAILTVCADVVERWTPLKGGWAKGLAWALLALAIIGFLWLLGAQIALQFNDLVDELPDMIGSLGAMIGVEDLYGDVTARAADLASRGTILGDLAFYTSSAAGVLTSLLIVLVTGIFLALDPQGYRRGVLALVPDGHADKIDSALSNAARALRLWLVGKVITMAVIGLTTGIALHFVGLPSALALGVIAAVAEFVPFVGPILAALPALLIALPMGWTMVLWVAGIYLFIQQVESNVLIPIVQRRTADLPPVVGLLSIVAFTLLFGLPGTILGTPLTIVGIVLVKQLYVRGALGHDAHLPGEPESGNDTQRNEG